MSTKNLGNVRALISSPTPPTNKSLIWEDTSVVPYVKKAWNNSTNVWELLTPTGSSEEVTIDNAAPYSDSTIYFKAGVVVVFSNPLSSDPQFQTPQLYQVAVVMSIAGINPEESPYDSDLGTGNWQFIGQKLEVVNDNTSKGYISGQNPSNQLKSITGYSNGDTVVYADYNTVMVFNKDAVIGAYNPAINSYVEVAKPYDWGDPSKGGWVEQCSKDRQRKFYSNAADIRSQARNYPIGGDVVDLSTGNILRLTDTGAPFTDNGTTVIIPDFKLFGVACAFVKVGEIGGGGGASSHVSLTDINGDAAYQHINTTVFKTTPIDADSVALKNSASGNVELVTIANLKTLFSSTRTLSTTAWVATDTALTLTYLEDKDFATGTPVSITTTVTITLTAQPSGLSANYWFKFKAGTGWGFVWPAGYTASPNNDTITAGSTYEVDFKQGVYIIRKVA